MPCYAVRTMSVELATANRSLLEKSVAALGLTIDGNAIFTPQGIISLDGKTARCSEIVLPHVNAIRVQYSKEAISLVASKHGWAKQQIGANKIMLKKGI